MTEGLDVIVVNFRTPDDLGTFLASYMATDKPPGELFVYNVAPEKEDRNVVDVWREDVKLSVMESRSNNGYAHAVNSWARHCTHDAIAIFNADVVLTEGALNRCYRELMAHPDWGVLGPRQVDGNGRITHAGIMGERGEVHIHRQWHMHTEMNEDEDLVIEVATVMGSAMFVKRACWEQLALCPEYLDHLYNSFYFRERPFGAMLPTLLYYEETFLCYHAAEHGWKVVYYGPVTLIHEWHKSINKNISQNTELHIVEISKRQFQQACAEVHGMPCLNQG